MLARVNFQRCLVLKSSWELKVQVKNMIIEITIIVLNVALIMLKCENLSYILGSLGVRVPKFSKFTLETTTIPLDVRIFHLLKQYSHQTSHLI